MRSFLNFLLSLILSALLVLLVLIKFDVVHVQFGSPKQKTIDEYINNGLQLSDESLSKSIGMEDRFYYNQLSDTAKIIYDKLIEKKDTLKQGNKEIHFDRNEFDSLLLKEDGMTILSEEYQNAADAIRYDEMELFYIDFTKMALRTITYTRGRDKSFDVYLAPLEENGNYLEDNLTSIDIEIMQDRIDEKTEEVLKQAQGTNYQKIQYIHDYLIDNISYDQTYEADNNRNIYGALIYGDVVCEGYAKTFKYLLDKLEIPCIIVAGEAVNSEGVAENHMWNYVKINDIWYSIDVTWDDPIMTNGGTLPEEYRYKYFCQGDNINNNHTLSDTITKNGQSYEYPELYHKE